MNTKETNLSVCMIVRNEERFIEKSLRSVLPIANEIIVVDTGSTDRTLEIVAQFPAKIHHFEWKNDFSEARNFAISLASSPFIFSIDADEELQNPESIVKLLQTAKDDEGGWLVNNISFASRKGGIGYDTFATKLLRIFRRHPKIRFTGQVHEQIHESIFSLGLKIRDSEALLLHYGYSLSPKEMQDKQLRNLNLLLSALEREPTNSYLLFQIAKTYLALDKLIDANNYIQLCLQYVKPESAVRPQALNYGGIISFKYGDYTLAIERALESLKIIPNQSFANFILGETYSAMMQYEKALGYYFAMETALRNPDPKALVVGDYFLPFEQLFFRIGRCFIGMQLPKEAEKYFRMGLDTNPNDFDCIRGLANALVLQYKFNDARTLLQTFAFRVPELNNEIEQLIKQINQMENKTESRFVHSPLPATHNVMSNPTGEKTENNTDVFISLSMIVKNEEKYLEGCLESVRAIADEIVIVDTGSTDRTKEIASNYGARIFDFQWSDDFAVARNESLRHCRGQWIIYLDADERIVHPKPESLIDILRNAQEDIGAFYCLIESEHYQMDGSTELHRGGYPRIFRNLGYPKIKFIGRVHEQIAPSIFENGYKIVFSDITIRHLGYNQSREVMEEKIRRNYRMLIAHVQEEPLNGYAWYQLGQTLAQMSLFSEAEKAIRMAIQTKTLSKSVFASAASTLAKMLGNQGKYDETLYWAEKSLENAPEQIYALHLKAYALLYLRRFEESEATFVEVLQKLRQKRGIPLAGFDIQIPEELVLKGLEMAHNKRLVK